MDPMRGGGIQMLLTAEQEAQQIVADARKLKMTKLKQAMEQSEREAAQYRSQLEAEYQNSISQNIGSSDSTVKRLETETEAKIEELNNSFSKAEQDSVAILIKYITKV